MSTVTPGAAPRRRRGSEETAAAIERAALELVARSGYDAVTVDMICEAAGVSQRTFFNHFKTKDAVLLGADLPRIDEQAARRFLVADGPLLLDAIALLTAQAPGVLDRELVARRLELIATTPVLLARQMERLIAIEGDLRELLLLRLQRQGDADDPVELARQAELISHVLAGVMRFVLVGAGPLPGAPGGPAAPGTPTDAPPDAMLDPASLERTLRRAFDRLW